MLTEYLDKGQTYRQLKKVISVSITCFNLGTGKDFLYYGSTDFVGVRTQDILAFSGGQFQEYGFQEVRKVFPEYYLIQVGKFSNAIRDPIDEWIYMLKYNQVKSDFTAKYIQKAGEKLRVINLPSNKRKVYERFMDSWSYEASMLHTSHVEGIQQGIKQGIEQGIKQGIKQTAKNMLVQEWI